MQQQNNKLLITILLSFSYWQRDIYSALYMLGMLFGSYFFGWVSDKYGRKNALMASIITVSISGFLGYVNLLALTGAQGRLKSVFVCSFTRS